MGKKIEKLETPKVSRATSRIGYGDKEGRWLEVSTIAEKINEIIEWIEEQEKTEKRREEPEDKKFAPYFDNDYRCPECQEELLVTCKHPLELYCTCCRRDINLDEMEEGLTFVKETLPRRKTENNTEEWKEKFREIDSAYDRWVRGGTGRGEVDWQLEDIYIEFIEQLLSERSFSKEELETLKQIIETHDGHRVGYEALSDMEEKIDRLLSLESN